MHIVALLFLLLPTLSTAKVYKYLDSSGRVVYSDQKTQGGVEVKIKRSRAASAAALIDRQVTADKSKSDVVANSYSVEILVPRPNTTNRLGSVKTVVLVKPIPPRDFDVVLLLDEGQAITKSSAANSIFEFLVPNLTPGQHLLQAQLVNKDRETITLSEIVSIYSQPNNNLTLSDGAPRAATGDSAPVATVSPTNPSSIIDTGFSPIPASILPQPGPQPNPGFGLPTPPPQPSP